jgi:preprotein translocase subunit SecF
MEDNNESKIESHNNEPKSEPKQEQPKKSVKQALFELYEKKYRLLLIIPMLILFLAIAQIAYQIHTTGDFIKKDVSLKGGVTITIPYRGEVDILQLENDLSNQFPENDASARILKTAGVTAGVIVELDVDGNDKSNVNRLLGAIGSSLKIDMNNVDYGLEIIGSSLGSSFFRESLIALAIAFLFMGLVVLIYFRTLVPSLAIILAAISDIIVALAVVNLLGIRVGTAGIAAFLMLIGYSVDTDILLTVRVLKRKEGSVMDRIISSMKTGMTMTITAIVAAIVAFSVTQSDVIKQIMLILLIGLFADIFFTWIQNVALLRMHVEKKERKRALI